MVAGASIKQLRRNGAALAGVTRAHLTTGMLPLTPYRYGLSPRAMIKPLACGSR